MKRLMSSMASAGWCIEHLSQQNNDNFSKLNSNLSNSSIMFLHLLIHPELLCSSRLFSSRCSSDEPGPLRLNIQPPASILLITSQPPRQPVAHRIVVFAWCVGALLCGD